MVRARAPAVQPVQNHQAPTVDIQGEYNRQRQEHAAKQAKEAAYKQKLANEAKAHQLALAQNVAKEEARQKQLKEQAIAAEERAKAQRAAYNKTQAEKRAKAKQLQKDQEDAANFAEAARQCQEERRERELRLARKEELRKDPTAIYHSYHDYLACFPLDTAGGEKISQYHNKLLANRPFPKYDSDSELGLAITYAKDNWDLYLEYPKQVKYAAEQQRKKVASIAAGGIAAQN